MFPKTTLPKSKTFTVHAEITVGIPVETSIVPMIWRQHFFISEQKQTTFLSHGCHISERDCMIVFVSDRSKLTWKTAVACVTWFYYDLVLGNLTTGPQFEFLIKNSVWLYPKSAPELSILEPDYHMKTLRKNTYVRSLLNNKHGYHIFSITAYYNLPNLKYRRRRRCFGCTDGIYINRSFPQKINHISHIAMQNWYQSLKSAVGFTTSTFIVSNITKILPKQTYTTLTRP